MSPQEMGNAVEKIKSTGNSNILLTERGTFFGYNRLVNRLHRIGCDENLWPAGHL